MLHNRLMGEGPSAAKRILKFVGLLLLAGLVFAGWRFGPTLWDLWRGGHLQGLFGEKELREYRGNSMQNLRALHLALSLYHESEGQFPHASGWMDAIQPYMLSADMKKEESMKKLVNPLIVPARKGVYGYAMNDAASAKYKDDVPDPSQTPLVFDSAKTEWNAHGDPQQLLPEPPRQGGNLGISVDGVVLLLEKGKPPTKAEEPSPAKKP
jgi:hypothetical protein